MNMTKEQLKTARLKLGLSRAKLGALTEYSYCTIRSYEQGARPVSPKMAKAVKKMLGKMK